MVLDALGKVVQSNARFAECDSLEVHLDQIRIPNGNGGVKTKGMSLCVLSAIKKCIVVVKAAFLCTAHSLIIAMARVNGDPKYKSHRSGRCLPKPFEVLLAVSGVDLFNGGVLKNFNSFRSTVRTSKLLCLMDLNLIG
jgi:hypothetical protein